MVDRQHEGASSVASGGIARELDRLAAQGVSPGLHVVATPIGHLGDITLRALSTLAAVDLILCEDTRRSRILLDHYGIDRPVRAYHEHNAERERPGILARLARGERIALISDAGTPLVSDPGYKLVREAADQGHAVIAVPGPSALLAGLVVSGLPTDTFLFAGFLPPRSAARRARLEGLGSVAATLVLFETAARLPEVLADAADVLGGERPAVLARELTKRFEDIRRGTLASLAGGVSELAGEVVLLIGPPLEREVGDDRIREELGRWLTTVSVKDAVKMVAEALKVPKSRVYELAVALKRDT